MREDLKAELVDIFKDRAAFHQIERMLYSTDLDPPSEMIKQQINTMPDAVVQPENVQELTALLGVGTKYQIPLVPRGSGTAWFGGCVPTRGGIVVDFYRMNKISAVDKGKKTATVEPGVVWNDLEAELRGQGLALRCYPSSAVSSTVGGWVANGGGVGVGSFEYGLFNESLVEVEIITPTGTRTLSGDDLSLVYALSGTTGFISRVTIKVRDAEEDMPVLAAFPGLADVVGMFTDIKKQKLALWHVSSKDPTEVMMARRAIENQAKRSPVHHEVKEPKLPEGKYIALFVFPASRESKVKAELLNIIKAHSGEVLSQDLAAFEWGERFYPLRFKSMGPSSFSSEVTIPTENIPAFVKKTMKGLNYKEMGFENTLVHAGKESLVIVYALDDERRRGYPMTAALKLVPIEIGLKMGGTPYGTGIFLTCHAEAMFGGKEKLEKIYEFKDKVDPDHIMNPGKVFPPSVEKGSPIGKLAVMVMMGKSATGMIKLMDGMVGGKPKGESLKSKTIMAKMPFAKETAWDALSCSACGYCRTVCREFGAVKWESASPRGKFHFLREYLNGKVEMDVRMAESFFLCTTCQRCNLECQLDIPIIERWDVTMRPTILNEGFKPPTLFQRSAHNVIAHHNSPGLDQNVRAAWVTPDLKFSKEGDTAYFAGCASSFLYSLRNLPINALRIMNKGGIEPVYLGADEWCCSSALLTAGGVEQAKEGVTHNINEFNKRGIKTLIVSCPGCWIVFSHYYPTFAKLLGLKYDIRVRHITQVTYELIEQGKIKLEKPVPIKVTYHDSCHIGRGGGIFDEPRKILTSIPGLELVEMPRNREQSACCGKHVSLCPTMYTPVTVDRINEAINTGVPALTVACPTCEQNMRRCTADIKTKLEIIDISDFVAESMGLPRLSVSKLAKVLRAGQREAGKPQG